MNFEFEDQLEGAGEATSISLQDVPENVLLQILQYLPMADNCRVRRVSKTWNRILSDNSLWTNVDLLEFYIDVRTMRKIVRTHFSPSLLTLKMQGHSDPGYNIRRRSSLSDALLHELSARCPNLHLLHLSDCKTSSFLFESLPPSIKCLEIVHSKWRPGWMRGKQMCLPNLEHLILDNTCQVADFDLEDVAVWKNLKQLSLRGCFRIGTEGVITIAQNLLELECLNFCDISIDDLGVDHIAQNLKKLKELCIAESLSITDRAIASIAEGFPVLNKLDISYCEQVTMRGLQSLYSSKISILVAERVGDMSQEQKDILKSGFPEDFVLIA